MSETTPSRNLCLDAAKGGLIVLVILGHAIPGAVAENFLRYAIYAVHMPLFVGVAGYLLRAEILAALSLRELVQKYFGRVVLPWLLALHVYYLVDWLPALARGEWRAAAKAYGWSLVHPGYHLWFVCGYLLYIVVLWVALRHLHLHALSFPTRWTLVLCATALVSLFFLLQRITFSGHWAQQLWTLIVDDFNLQFFFYFALGMFLREAWDKGFLAFSRRTVLFLGLCAGIAGAVTAWFFFVSAPRSAAACATMALNTSALFLLLNACRRRAFCAPRALVFLGRESLAFYLWHMLFVRVALLLAPQGGLLYYTLCVALIAALAVCIRAAGRAQISRALLLGHPQKGGRT